MSPVIRWIIAVIVAIILIASIIVLGAFSMLALGFGLESCRSLPDNVVLLYYLPPVLMIIGVLASSILFGLKKRWFWWVGAFVGSAILGFLVYIVWITMITQMC